MHTPNHWERSGQASAANVSGNGCCSCGVANETRCHAHGDFEGPRSWAIERLLGTSTSVWNCRDLLAQKPLAGCSEIKQVRNQNSDRFLNYYDPIPLSDFQLCTQNPTQTKG